MKSESTPRVSVLLPARNAAATIDACLSSLVRQRETRWECVAVDDGSTDSTGRTLRDFARTDTRLRVIPGPGNGLVEALTIGLAECRAPIVARMDADDWMHRDRLHAQLERLEAEPDLAGVGCHVRIFPRRDLTNGLRDYESWLNQLGSPASVWRDAFVECPIAHPTLMMRRRVFEQFGYRDAGWPEDYDLVLRTLAAGEKLAVVERRLLGWRDHPTRLSRTHSDYALERFVACKAAQLAEGFLADRSEYVLWGYGPTAKALRRALLVHGREPSHIVELHPRRIGQRIHGAPVIAPDGLRELERPRLLVSVAGRRPRGEIRAWLTNHGHRETIDFFCTA